MLGMNELANADSVAGLVAALYAIVPVLLMMAVLRRSIMAGLQNCIVKPCLAGCESPLLSSHGRSRRLCSHLISALLAPDSWRGSSVPADESTRKSFINSTTAESCLGRCAIALPPTPKEPKQGPKASKHRLVWVDFGT